MSSHARIAVFVGVASLLASLTIAEEKTLRNPFASDNPEERCRACGDLAEMRYRSVAQAVEVLKSTKGDFKGDFLNPDPRSAAIQVVETFRAPEATVPLCNMIDAWAPAFGATGEVGNIVDDNGRLVKGRLQVGAHYPAAKALVAIGLPATTECLNRLRAHGCTSRSWLYLWVIRESYGEKLGRLVIKERFTTGEDGRVHSNCKEILAEYDRLESDIEK